MLTEKEALDQGYTLDRQAGGRTIAYKGRRFAPTAVQGVFTELEEAALNLIRATTEPGALPDAQKAFDQACAKHGVKL